MAPFDPILHEHEKRLALLEAARRTLEDQMIVMADLERRDADKIQDCREWLAEQTLYLAERERQHKEWQDHHELAMKEFDDKLNGLIAWLDAFVKHNPKNGK